MTSSNPSHRLAEVPLLAGLAAAALDELAKRSITHTYPKGQFVFWEGDPGDSLLVLERGQLRVSRLSADGQEVVLAVMEAPTALGELSLLDGAPRDATVTAQSTAVVRIVPRSVFFDLIRREPAFVDGLLKMLAGLVRAGNTRHADLLALDVPGRLAKWLLKRAAPGVDGLVVELGRSQGELAIELSTTRSTLNRAIKEFEKLGLIKDGRTQIWILKPDDLRAAVS